MNLCRMVREALPEGRKRGKAPSAGQEYSRAGECESTNDEGQVLTERPCYIPGGDLHTSHGLTFLGFTTTL